MKEKLTANILFSGIGCQERGIENTGLFDLEVVSTSEINKDSILTYSAIHCGLTNETVEAYPFPSYEEMVDELTAKNIGFNPDNNTVFNWQKLAKDKLKKYWLANHLSRNIGDISLVERLPYADLWTSSFPCTDISYSGHMKGLKSDSNTRSSLLWQTIRLLKTSMEEGTSPKFILFENVKSLVGKTFLPDFLELTEILSTLQYNCYWQILDAKDCGVPQSRERVFLLCIRKDIDTGNFRFPDKLPLTVTLNEIVERDVPDRYYLDASRSKNIILRYIEKNGVETFIERCSLPNEKGVYLSTCFSVAVRGRYAEGMSSGPTEQCLEIQKQASIYSNAITTVQKDSLILERIYVDNISSEFYSDGVYRYRLRKQTPTEVFLLMGLTSDDVKKAKAVGVPETALYSQAGNGIVADCVQLIFINLFSALKP